MDEGEHVNSKCATFIIKNEDHTLGNLLRYVITRYPDVEFCGYSMPHPSEAKMHLRIQCSSIQRVMSHFRLLSGQHPEKRTFGYPKDV